MPASEESDATVNLLANLIRYRSLSHDEAEAAEFVADVLSHARVQVDRVGDNVVARLGDGNKALLMNSHLDVVPPSADHPYPPFEPTIRDGRLYGRGSVDAKASVAAMVQAIVGLASDGWLPPEGHALVAALTVCEEVGGIDNGLEQTRPHLPELEAALIGEPTSLAPCIAQRGMLILEATAHGRTAHAARPHLGSNAVEMMARDVCRIADRLFDRPHPLLGDTIASVTIVEGGTAHNVIPDRCRFTIDVRLTPTYDVDDVIRIIGEAIESTVSVRSQRYIPVETDSKAAIVRASVKATQAKPFGSATASDWIYVRDIPTVKIGPGDSSLSHTAEESIELTELARAPTIYRNIITSYYDTITDE